MEKRVLILLVTTSLLDLWVPDLAFGHKPSLSEMFWVSPLQGLAPGEEALLQRAACAEQVHSVIGALVTDRAAQGHEVASVFQD